MGIVACLLFVLHPGRLELGIVIAFLVLAGAYSLFSVYQGLWSYFGIERISIDTRCLLVEKSLLGFRVGTKRYSAESITDLRSIECEPLARGLAHPLSVSKGLGFGVGPVVFRYNGEDVRLAEALRGDAPAADELAQRLKSVLGMGE